jgi:hypothetical protein
MTEAIGGATIDTVAANAEDWFLGNSAHSKTAPATEPSAFTKYRSGIT